MIILENIKSARSEKYKVKVVIDSRDELNSRVELDGKSKFDDRNKIVNNEFDNNEIGKNEFSKKKNHQKIF